MYPKALLAIIAVALVGCGPGIKVTQDVDNMVGMDLHTYGFLKDSDDLSAQQRALNRRVRDLLKVHLKKKGYKQVSRSPDFIVGQFGAAVFTLEEVEDSDDLAKRLEQRELMSGDTELHERLNFDDARLKGTGTLLIFMSDPATRDVFWRSRAESDLAFEGQGEEKIDEAVALIMKNFPQSQMPPAN